MTRRIDSPDNPIIQRVRSLRDSRRRRWTERAFVVEGPRFIADLTSAGIRPEALLLSDAVPVGSPLRAAHHLEVGPRAWRAVADTEHGQGVLAVFAFPPLGLTRPSPRLVLMLDGVQDPGNAGTLLRSAAASGADGVFLTTGTVDPFNPKVLRASAGAVGVIQLEVGSPSDILGSGMRILVAAGGAGATPYDEVDWTIPSVVVVGSEGDGASASVVERADVVVGIPMAPGVESLNAGVAGSILLFEAARQRRRADAVGRANRT